MRPTRRRSGPEPRRRSPSTASPIGVAAAAGAGAALLLLLVSCGGDEAALRVDGASFTEEGLLGLSAERRSRLAELTALGLAFARDEPERLGAPLLERRREDLLLERFRAALVLDRRDVGDDVLRARYGTDPRYELVVRHAVALADPEDPDSVHRAARATAERALERIESGEAMADVAADLSEEPGAAERGGRLQPGREGSWVPEFWRAANSLEEGEHTGVVRTRYGYHVIRLEERRVVPFEEVRSEAVLEAGRMLGGMEEAWTAWSDSVSATVRIDTAALRGWREDVAVTVDTAARFRIHVVSLDEDRWSRAVDGPPEETVEELRRAAVRSAGLTAARRRGLRVPSGEQERLAREWRDQVAGWAAALGFRPGASDAAVADRALLALSTTQQNARIARRELESRGPLLRAAYSIRGLERETGEGGGS